MDKHVSEPTSSGYLQARTANTQTPELLPFGELTSSLIGLTISRFSDVLGAGLNHMWMPTITTSDLTLSDFTCWFSYLLSEKQQQLITFMTPSNLREFNYNFVPIDTEKRKGRPFCYHIHIF